MSALMRGPSASQRHASKGRDAGSMQRVYNPATRTMTTTHASRRRFIRAAAAGGTATLGFPAIVRAQAPVKWRVQTAHVAGTSAYKAFQKFCANVKGLSEGKVEFQPFPAEGVPGTLAIVERMKEGTVTAADRV